MRNYEVTFIVDPVLSGDEIKATAQTYVQLLESNNCSIVHMDEMGLRQLAYPLNKRSTGIYYCIEFQCETGEVISTIELAFRRDERIMRFLSIGLDKYGVKYNEDKRNGLIGNKRKNAVAAAKAEAKKAAPAPAPVKAKAPAPAPKVAAPAPTPEPVAVATEVVSEIKQEIANEEEE